jgi:hypothetical protein
MRLTGAPVGYESPCSDATDQCLSYQMPLGFKRRQMSVHVKVRLMDELHTRLIHFEDKLFARSTLIPPLGM